MVRTQATLLKTAWQSISSALSVFTVAFTLVCLSQSAIASDENLKVDVNPPGTFRTINCLYWCFGSWWVGCDNGLFRVNIPGGGKAITLTVTKRFPEVGMVKALCEFNGFLWVGSLQGLFHVDPNAIVRTLPKATGVPDLEIRCLHSFGGYLWIGAASSGVFRWKGQGTAAVPVTPLVPATSFDESGTNLWISTESSLYHWEADWGEKIPEETALQTIVYSTHPIGDALWFGGQPGGIFRWVPGPKKDFEPISQDAGKVHGFLQAGPTLWVASDAGLYSWRKDLLRPESVGLRTGRVSTLYRPPSKGPVWILTENEIYRLDGADDRAWEPNIWFSSPSSAQLVAMENLRVTWGIGNYAWRTTPELVRWRVKVTNPATDLSVHDSGLKEGGLFEYTVPPLKKGSYKLTVEVTDLNGVTAFVAFREPITVSSRLPSWLPHALAVSLGSLVLVLAAGRWALADPGRVRWLYEKVGYEYALSGPDCRLVYELSYSEQRRIKLKDTSKDPGPNKYECFINLPANNVWPPSFAEPCSPPVFPSGSDVQLEIDRDDVGVPISKPWGSVLNAKGLSEGNDAVIVGQRLIVHTPQPLLTGSLSLAALSSGEDPFRNVGRTIGGIVKKAHELGVGITGHQYNASPDDFHNALIYANIVFLQAHGDRGYVQFSNERYYDRSWLDKLPMDIRCRLLILASCRVGDGGEDESLLRGLQLRGINVIASTILVKPGVISLFMKKTLEAFLPAARFEAEGKTLAACLRGAGDYCISPEAGFNLTGEEIALELNSYVLYGNPNLRVVRVSKHQQRRFGTLLQLLPERWTTTSAEHQEASVDL